MKIELVCIAMLALGVGALPSRRLRRKDSLIEISTTEHLNQLKTKSSGLAFHEDEDEYSEMIRLLQESDIAMSTSSMSMSMVTDVPSSTPSSVPSATPPPVTGLPTSMAPVTVAPTTNVPVTAAPSISTIVTPAPTTLAPTTGAPTTVAPVTGAPTTLAPTTGAPTTAAPVTTAPTTSAPVTPAPTIAPVSTIVPTTILVPVTPAPVEPGATAGPTTITVSESDAPSSAPTGLTPAPVGMPMASIVPTTILVPSMSPSVMPSSSASIVPTTILVPNSPASVVPSLAPTILSTLPGGTPVASIVPTTILVPNSPASVVPSLAPTTLSTVPGGTPVASMVPTTILVPNSPAPVEPGSTAGPTTIFFNVTDEPSAAPADSSMSSPAPTLSGEQRDEIIVEKCAVTSLERSRDILSILSVISDPVDLITPSSPQFLARDWIDNRDQAVICASETAHIDQRYRVALLYYSLGGPTWLNCRAWEDSESSDMCLEEDLRTARHLKKMMTEGSDPKSIADYKPRAMRHLQQVEGKFDEEESTRWLTGKNECEWFGLDCGDAFVEGGSPDFYSPLVNIDLGNNNLMGTLIPEIFGFTELQALFLDGNTRIAGSIPEELGQMSGLKFLDIDDSELTGPLPTSLFNLTDLIVIDLNSNQLTGTLSAEIGAITGLEILQLENNSMTGEIPTEALLDLARLGTCNFVG